MSLRSFLALLSLVWAQGLWAQTVSVRSGEHGDFTRFVMRIPEATTWSVDRSGKEAALTVDLPDIRFETGGVFARIPRDRVQELSQSGPRAPLRFVLNCDCDVTAFVHDRVLLVIDVSDPAGTSPAGLVAAASRTAVGQIPYRFPVVSAEREQTAARPQVILPVTFEPTAETGKLPAKAEARLPDAGRLLAVRTLERQLTGEIGRAARQGLLEVSAAMEPTEAREHADEETIGHSGRPEQPPTEPEANILVSTPLDQDMEEIAHALAGHQNGVCPPSRDLALQDWSDGSPLPAQIARGRAGLIGEFDMVNREAAMTLARAYLHFGFGAEAESILAILPENGSDTALLTALAQIIETGGSKSPNPFSGRQSCDSDAALWAIVSEPQRLAEANDNAVLLAAGRLPAPLRELVGPRLSLIYSEAGDVDMAEAVLRTVERVADGRTPVLDLARASTADLRGHAQEADKQRLEVVNQSSEASAKALIDLVDSQFRRDGTVAPHIPELAAAYATEQRDGDLGPRLRRAEALAQALAGDFTGAFGALDRIAEHDGQDARQQAALDVLKLLSARGADATFMQFALRETQTAKAGFPEDPGNALARRFLDLGFPRPAIRLLASQGETNASPARRLLRAEAALADNLPREAMAALLPLSGPQADRLRGEALAQLKDHARAAEHFAAAAEPEAAARNMWLAGDLDAISETSTSRYGSIARTAGGLTDDGSLAKTRAPLSGARHLIESSTAMRGEIASLLSAAGVEDLPAD